MIYFVATISSFLSGLGIGGGSLFALILIMLKTANLNEIRTYNLAMFVSLGGALAIKNRKELKNEKIKIIKMLIFVVIGSFFGTKASNFISQTDTIIIFNALMLALGIYEIFASLKNMNTEQNNTMKGEK